MDEPVTVLRPIPLDPFEFLSCEDYDDIDRLIDGNEATVRETWRPPVMKRFTTDDRGRPLAPSDFPWWISFTLFMTERAKTALEDLLAPHGAFVPAMVDNGTLWAYLCGRIDALDEPRSEVHYHPDSDRVLTITRYAFRPDALVGVDAFRVTFRGSDLFVSPAVAQRVADAGLVGLEFEEVWRQPEC